MDKKEMIQHEIFDLFEWGIVLVLSFFVFVIGVSNSKFLLIFISLVIFIMYGLLLYVEISKINLIDELFTSAIYSFEYDLDEIHNKHLLLRDGRIIKTRSFLKLILISLPFSVGIFILIGLGLNSPLIMIVIPGFLIALLLCSLIYFFVIDNIKINEKKVYNETILKISNKIAYIQGKLVIINHGLIKSKLSFSLNKAVLKTYFLKFNIDKTEFDISALEYEKIKDVLI